MNKGERETVPQGHMCVFPSVRVCVCVSFACLVISVSIQKYQVESDKRTAKMDSLTIIAFCITHFFAYPYYFHR